MHPNRSLTGESAALSSRSLSLGGASPLPDQDPSPGFRKKRKAEPFGSGLSGHEAQASRSDHDDRDSASLERLQELERQLAEKEQLVTLLTERLEQAAEKLDRHRRTGHLGAAAEFGGGGVGLPADVVEDHKALVDELREAVQQWQDMQAAAAVGRLECQIAELRDLLTNQMLAPALPAAPPPVVDPGSLAAALSKLGAPTTAAPPAELRAAAAPKPNSWEARKAALLAADGIEPPPEPASKPAARPIAAGSRAPLEEVPHDREEPAAAGLQPLPDAPPALDVAHATAGQFREAILERDHYIELLRRHLHTVRAFEPLPVRITGLDELPPEQRQQIEAWERELQEKHRRTEIDLSLERARLSRDQTNLRQQQEQIRKELRRLGLQNESDGEPEAASPAHDDESAHQHKSSARWLRFLGGGKRNDADRASE